MSYPYPVPDAPHLKYALYDPETGTVTSRFRTRKAADAAKKRSGKYANRLRIVGIHSPEVKQYKKKHRYFQLTPEQRRRMVA